MPTLWTVSGDALLVDECDLPRLVGKRLYTHRTARDRRHPLTYATFVEPKPTGGQRTVLVHRFIMDAPTGTQVDHRDHDGLNNQRSNLRISTPSQNGANKAAAPGTSQFKGVSWAKDRRQWMAAITVNKTMKNLGMHPTEEEAARVYDAAASAAWGEFAVLNFPDEPLVDLGFDPFAPLAPRGRSGFWGVGWDARSKKWLARLADGQRRIVLGAFDDPEQAARAYDVAARAAGKTSRLNFPPAT